MEVKIIRLDNDTIPKSPEPEPILYILKSGGYILKCHKCGYNAFLNHDVTWNNGKVTINPSLICPQSNCEAHYYIKDGVIC